MSKRKTRTSAAGGTAAREAFCVYLGPSIRGVITSGTVIAGDEKAAAKALAGAIEKYPLIQKLLVTGSELPRARIDVKTPGTLLNVYRQRLIQGLR